ncbi:hypothetical protein HK100_001018 [Physocladia obscura]|uniref:Kynurenine 3-monooxygenase n=1 Tax=Physocladia obscura TaxID=109957 RepID=A0AAD5T0A4_9FUNG|nr:hypothetical protein HK100_001018 [Physocladia obscura]
MDKNEFHVAIIGGGLVGALNAVYFASRGWRVTVYEMREDIRTTKIAGGRSINLALSVRGISALETAGVGRGLLDTLIPMKGRMLHLGKTGRLTSQNYGYFGEAINSVDRKLVNQHLLSMAEKNLKVTLKFQQEILSIDYDKKILSFKQADGKIVKAAADLIVGADGAFSRVRRELMRVTRMNFSQNYIEHAYVELSMPSSASGEYVMDPNHLHIWPRQSFMMIALPNIDKSFTVTVFMPWANFDAIKTEANLLEFFETYFADAIPLIGKELLVKDFFKNPKGSLMSIKCKPYHYKSSCVIIGDAAHAMVPFYGQGMNCGFEDCLVLDEILTKHIGARGSVETMRPSAEKLALALEEYSATRNPDAEAICDLAMDNYIEMRSSVTKLGYKVKKSIEGFMHRLLPKTVIPLYTMVSFSRIPYSKALTISKSRTILYDRIGKVFGYGVTFAGLVVGGVVWIKYGGGLKRIHGFFMR